MASRANDEFHTASKGCQRLKLVACDLDGTLLGPEERMIEKACGVARFLRSKDLLFTIATGRVLGSVEPLLKTLEVTAPVIANGGAVVAWPRGPILLERKLEPGTSNEIANELRRLGVPFYFTLGSDMLTEWAGEETDQYSRAIGYRIGIVPPGALSGKAPAQIVVRIPEEDAEGFLASYGQRWLPHTQAIRSLPHLIEFQAPGVSKASALSFLAKRYGLGPNEVLAIGDGLNDLDMLEWAGTSACVENAHPMAKKASSYVASKPYAEGVQEIIEKLTK